MPAQTHGRTILLLCIKFALLAPVCLVAWLLIMPAYAWVLAHVTGAFLRFVLGKPIEGAFVNAAGLLNTGTELGFVMTGGARPAMRDVGHLVTNVAPFVALVLATDGVTIKRRLKILGIGVGIMVLAHALTIILRFVAGRSVLPTAIGFLSITLPFLLWIVLAYWDKLLAYFAVDDGS